MPMEQCVKGLREHLDQFDATTARLEESCGKIGTEQDCQRLRDQMTKDKEALAKLRAPIRAQFAELKKLEKEEESGYYEELSGRWGPAWNKFSDVQRTMKKALKEPPPTATRKIAGTAHNDHRDDEDDVQMGGGGIQLTQLKRYDVSAAATEEAIQKEKAEELAEIAADMGQLNHVYREFADLVNDQAEPLQKVDETLEHAQVDIQNGTENLRTASDYQKSSRKKMCCAIVLVLIIILIGVIVVVVAS